MLSLLQKCANAPLDRHAVLENLRAIRFTRDVLPGMYKTEWQANNLRSLLLRQDGFSRTGQNHAFSSSMYSYFETLTENVRMWPSEDSVQRGTPPLDSLFHIDSYISAQKSYSIGVINLAQKRHCDVTCFVLPPFCEIPLHDHPSLTVFMKVVYGSVRLVSFDAINPEGVNRSQPRAPTNAHMIANEDVEAKDPVLVIESSGRGGSYHYIRAGQNGGIFIDVIHPPYGAPPSFAECTYYSALSKINSKHPQKGDFYTMVPSKRSVFVPMHLLPFMQPIKV